MKNKIKYIAILSFVILSMSQITFAQKALVVGFNYDSPDGVAIVALEDLPSTEVLFITETPYDPSTNTFDRSTANRGTWQLTWTGVWSEGTVIKFEGSPLVGTSGPGGPGSPNATSPYSDIVSFSNEGFSLFTASNTSDPDATPTEIYTYVVHDSSTGGVNDPDPSDDGDCPCSAGFISVDLFTSSTDHGQYMNALRTDGTPDGKAQFENESNWDEGTTNLPLDLTAFTSISLPIELITFNTTRQGKEVRIDWETANEINNDFFSIERSVDGSKFETIGKVRGAGNSFVPLEYSYIDLAPYWGINYYRLKQTDYDGTYTYSDIESVNFEEKSKDAKAYPNPFNESISLQFPFAEESYSTGDLRTVEVFDIYGKLALTIIFPMDENRVTLNLSELNSGTYFLHTLDGNKLVTNIQRIIKI